MTHDITVIGGGLAGCEAAWQLAERGLVVRLTEMKPLERTPAQKNDLLAELVGASRRTLVIVTHSERVAERTDRTLALEHGRLVGGVQSSELARQVAARGID